MDITKLQSATAGEQVMINMKTYTIKNDIELCSENQDDIYWQITMKNNIKFIVDNNNISKIINISYKDYDEFTAKWYWLRRAKTLLSHYLTSQGSLNAGD